MFGYIWYLFMLHITIYCNGNSFIKISRVLSRPHGTPWLSATWNWFDTWGYLGHFFPWFKASWQCTQLCHSATEMRTRHFGGEGAVPGQKSAKNPSNLSFLLPLLLSCCCTNIIPCSVTAAKEQKAVQVGGRDWLLQQCTHCLSSSAISGSLSL